MDEKRDEGGAPAEWDRQEGEPQHWFCRFERYRMMGIRRSMLGCVDAEAAEQGRVRKNDKVPGSWVVASAKWRWKERAQAWDAEQVRLTRLAEREAVEGRRKAWIAHAQALQGKASERLAAIEPGELTFRDVVTGVTEGVKLEMLARGEATDRHDHTITATVEQRRTRLASILDSLRQRSGTGGDRDAPEPPALPE